MSDSSTPRTDSNIRIGICNATNLNSYFIIDVFSTQTSNSEMKALVIEEKEWFKRMRLGVNKFLGRFQLLVLLVNRLKNRYTYLKLCVNEFVDRCNCLCLIVIEINNDCKRIALVVMRVSIALLLYTY